MVCPMLDSWRIQLGEPSALQDRLQAVISALHPLNGIYGKLQAPSQAPAQALMRSYASDMWGVQAEQAADRPFKHPVSLCHFLSPCRLAKVCADPKSTDKKKDGGTCFCLPVWW